MSANGRVDQEPRAGSDALFTAMPRMADLIALTKPRITAMVVVSTASGYYLGLRSPLDGWQLWNTLFGTALLSSAASALNQLTEREIDARMTRTSDRPLAAGRVDVTAGVFFGLLLAIVGLQRLWIGVNAVAPAVGMLTILLYVLVYTPLKRMTSLCTVVGAIPGALPPVMGWAAARNGLSADAWILFSILFLWQIPHFLAIAWLYRDDYARGGQPMLPVADLQGGGTSRQVVLYSLALLPVSLLPTVVGLCGPWYASGVLVLGAWYLAASVRAGLGWDRTSALRLLRVSVIYLPSTLALLTLDKVTA